MCRFAHFQNPSPLFHPWSYNSSADVRNFVNVLLCLAARRACYQARHTISLDPPSQSVLSRKTHNFFQFSQSVLSRKTHTRINRVCLLSLTSHPWHRHGAAAPRSSTAPSVTVKTPWGFIQTYLARHTGISFRFISQVLSMTSQPPRGRCAAAPHTAPFVTVRTHATSRLSGHCASTDECRVWPLLMNCVSSFNALHSTQFFSFARMSDHG